MDKYKPGYLGKVLPADDPSKINDFVQNKYDAFNKIYDTCKDKSDKIDNIEMVEDNKCSNDTLKVKISTNSEVIEKISEECKSKKDIKIEGNIITAKK